MTEQDIVEQIIEMGFILEISGKGGTFERKFVSRIVYNHLRPCRMGNDLLEVLKGNLEDAIAYREYFDKSALRAFDAGI